MYYLKPLYVVLAIVAAILVVRFMFVPPDFGIHERGYMYGWYRKSNEQEWKAFRGKYQGREFCKECHPDPFQELRPSPHVAIECENCHGPAMDHPSEPAKLHLDRSRELCLRCHTYLPYPTSKRAEIKGIDPDQHNPGVECVSCHDAHKATKPR